MDSGASFHDSPCKDLMKIFRTGNFGKVHLVDDETLDITSMRDINLRTSTSIVYTLKDVKYVPRLKRMLIFVGLLDVQGYKVIFRDDQWKVMKENLIVACDLKKGTLYMVELPPKEVNSISDVVCYKVNIVVLNFLIIVLGMELECLKLFPRHLSIMVLLKECI